MSERWRRRKKKDPWFNEIHEELERLGDLINETIQKASRFHSEKTEVHRTRIPDFSTKNGFEKKPRIQELNRYKLREERTSISDNPEPLIDLIDDPETIVVLASLPGVKREAISLRTTRNHLTIYVDTPKLGFHKELKFPTRVNLKSARAFYKNSVLEVRLKKSKATV